MFLLVGCASGPPRLVHHASEKESSLEDLRGSVVLMNFWATWCAPCIREIPALIQLADEMKGVVRVIAVHQDLEGTARPVVESWLSRNPAGFTPHIAYGNRSLHDRFPHDKIPTTYVLDANGEVVEKVTGALSLPRARKLVLAAMKRAAAPPVVPPR